jgi:hypothetical protein
MEYMQTKILIDKGGLSSSDTWKTLYGHIRQSIEAVVWPPGSDKFTIYPQSGKKRGEGNGVAYQGSFHGKAYKFQSACQR